VTKENITNVDSAKQYNYVPLTPQKVDRLARDIDERKVHGTWLMEPGQNPADCFLLLGMLPPAMIQRFRRLNLEHTYEYMHEAVGVNSKGQPTFMSLRLLDKRDIARVDKRLKEIRNAIGRTGI